jgi:hypothetical protein
MVYRNVNWFRGALVFKAHRPLYHSSLGVSVMTKKKKDTLTLVDNAAVHEKVMRSENRL